MNEYAIELYIPRAVQFSVLTENRTGLTKSEIGFNQTDFLFGFSVRFWSNRILDIRFLVRFMVLRIVNRIEPKIELYSFSVRFIKPNRTKLLCIRFTPVKPNRIGWKNIWLIRLKPNSKTEFEIRLIRLKPNSNRKLNFKFGSVYSVLNWIWFDFRFEV